jgi:hypothetical protein
MVGGGALWGPLALYAPYVLCQAKRTEGAVWCRRRKGAQMVSDAICHSAPRPGRRDNPPPWGTRHPAKEKQSCCLCLCRSKKLGMLTVLGEVLLFALPEGGHNQEKKSCEGQRPGQGAWFVEENSPSHVFQRHLRFS